MRYDRFHLVLMATHACNLCCDYCYTGRKLNRAMPWETGVAAIRRASHSLRPGGTLDLGFFGGEPLLQAETIARWIDAAQEIASAADIGLCLGMTTNGTVVSSAAWALMLRTNLELCISHDGLPEVHDRHRRRGDLPTAEQVTDTIARLLAAGREVRAVMVVRPDSAAMLPDGIGWLWDLGVRRFDPALDVWASWDRAGLEALEAGLIGAAEFWRQHLPEIGVSWFDEKAAHLLGLPIEASRRCGFGDGEVAVAPSGNLYPCERLIGEDRPDHPLRLPGHALDGRDFCRASLPGRSAVECAGCTARQQCNTTCRCNNYVRTGDIRRPDALLCFLDRVCVRETVRNLNNLKEFHDERRTQPSNETRRVAG